MWDLVLLNTVWKRWGLIGSCPLGSLCNVFLFQDNLCLSLEVMETTSVCLIHEFLSSRVLQWNGLVFWMLSSASSPTEHALVFSSLTVPLQQKLRTCQRSELHGSQCTEQGALSKHWGERQSFPYRVLVLVNCKKTWTKWYGRVIPQHMLCLWWGLPAALSSLGAQCFQSVRKKKSIRRLVKEAVSWQLGVGEVQEYFSVRRGRQVSVLGITCINIKPFPPAFESLHMPFSRRRQRTWCWMMGRRWRATLSAIRLPQQGKSYSTLVFLGKVKTNEMWALNFSGSLLHCESCFFQAWRVLIPAHSVLCKKTL